MGSYLEVITYSLAGSVVSLSIGALVLSKNKISKKFTKYATPFAAGALLAAVFIDLLPDGFEEGKPKTVSTAALIGVLLFFLAERFLRWFHHGHGDDHTHKKDASIPLIVTGNMMHNLLDGVAIAAAFLVNTPTGIVTTIAIAAHEIPHEIGDFGLLLAKGLHRVKVFWINVAIGLSTVVAAVATYAIGKSTELPTAFLVGVSAGFLLYIALSDLIPTVHQQSNPNKLVQLQTVMLLIGVAAVTLVVNLAHNYIEDSSSSHDETHQLCSQSIIDTTIDSELCEDYDGQ